MDFGDKPKLEFAGSGDKLNSPIRLVPDESNKENVHALESDDQQSDKEQTYKRSKIEYSSPEKIEMLNSLSPIKIDMEGNDGIESDLKKSVATAIEEAVQDFKKDSKAEEDEEEAFGKLNNGFRGYHESSTANASGSAGSDAPQHAHCHESLSPIRSYGDKEMPLDPPDPTVWEKKFDDLSSVIWDKYEEIKYLNDTVQNLRERTVEAEFNKERDKLELIKWEQKYGDVLSKLYRSEHKLEQFDELKLQFDSVSKKFEACKQKLKEVKIELSMTNQNNHILSEKFEKEYTKFTENENLVNEWKDKHDSLLLELNVKTKELKSITDELRSLKEQYERNENKLSEVESEIQELRKKMEEETIVFQDTIKQRDLSITELNKKLQQFEANGSDEVSSLKSKLQITEAELDSKKNEIESLNLKLSTKETALEELRSHITQVTEDKEKSLSELEQTKRDLDSLTSRNGNIESEHLAELERLHENMSHMETNLKQNVKTIANLNETVNNFENKCKSLEAENIDLKARLTQTETNVNKSETDELRAKIQKLEKMVADSEAETNKKLQLLAEDLYIQYSSKHEQKVKMLKKGYEAKYQDLLDKLTVENNALHDEVDQLQKAVEIERAEKQELIKSLDN